MVHLTDEELDKHLNLRWQEFLMMNSEFMPQVNCMECKEFFWHLHTSLYVKLSLITKDQMDSCINRFGEQNETYP